MTQPITREQLLACPFCGNKNPKLISPAMDHHGMYAGFTRYRYACSTEPYENCNGHPCTPVFSTIEEASRSWNTRAELSKPSCVPDETALKIFRYFESKYNLKIWGDVAPDKYNIKYCRDDSAAIQKIIAAAPPAPVMLTHNADSLDVATQFTADYLPADTPFETVKALSNLIARPLVPSRDDILEEAAEYVDTIKKAHQISAIANGIRALKGKK